VEAMLDSRMRSVKEGSAKPVIFPDNPCLLEDD